MTRRRCPRCEGRGVVVHRPNHAGWHDWMHWRPLPPVHCVDCDGTGLAPLEDDQ